MKCTRRNIKLRERFDIRRWDNLLTSAETLHEEFLDVVKERAPADDPRMKNLSEES